MPKSHCAESTAERDICQWQQIPGPRDEADPQEIQSPQTSKRKPAKGSVGTY